MNHNTEQNSNVPAVLADSGIGSTSVSMNANLLALGKIKAKKVHLTSFSALVANLTQKDLIASGWLTDDGQPTEKAIRAMQEAEANKKPEAKAA